MALETNKIINLKNTENKNTSPNISIISVSPDTHGVLENISKQPNGMNVNLYAFHLCNHASYDWDYTNKNKKLITHFYADDLDLTSDMVLNDLFLLHLANIMNDSDLVITLGERYMHPTGFYQNSKLYSINNGRTPIIKIGDIFDITYYKPAKNVRLIYTPMFNEIRMLGLPSFVNTYNFNDLIAEAITEFLIDTIPQIRIATQNQRHNKLTQKNIKEIFNFDYKYTIEAAKRVKPICKNIRTV